MTKSITVNRIKFDNAFRQKRNTSSKYTTKSIAHKLGIAPTTIYHLMDKTAEKNNKNLGLDTAIKLATGFDMTEDQARKWVHSIDPTAFSLKESEKEQNRSRNMIAHGVSDISASQQVIANIKRAMSSKKMSINDLYDKTQVNKGTLKHILFNPDASINRLTIARIAQGLGVKPNDLLVSKHKKPVQAPQSKNVNALLTGNALDLALAHHNHLSKGEINSIAKRSSVRRLAVDASKLSDVDVNLVDMLVQRMSEYKNK